MREMGEMGEMGRERDCEIVILTEGFLQQTKERLRSLLGVNEEAAL